VDDSHPVLLKNHFDKRKSWIEKALKINGQKTVDHFHKRLGQNSVE